MIFKAKIKSERDRETYKQLVEYCTTYNLGIDIEYRGDLVTITIEPLSRQLGALTIIEPQQVAALGQIINHLEYVDQKIR